MVLYPVWQRTRLNAESVQRNTAYSDAWYQRIEAIVNTLQQFKAETGRYPTDKAEFIAFHPSAVALYNPLPHQLKDKHIEIWFELLDEDEKLLIVPEPGYSYPWSSGELLEPTEWIKDYAHGTPWGVFNDLSVNSYSEKAFQRAQSLRGEE